MDKDRARSEEYRGLIYLGLVKGEVFVDGLAHAVGVAQGVIARTEVPRRVRA